jgi:hypothetical protein
MNKPKTLITQDGRRIKVRWIDEPELFGRDLSFSAKCLYTLKRRVGYTGGMLGYRDYVNWEVYELPDGRKVVVRYVPKRDADYIVAEVEDIEGGFRYG